MEIKNALTTPTALYLRVENTHNYEEEEVEEKEEENQGYGKRIETDIGKI